MDKDKVTTYSSVVAAVASIAALLIAVLAWIFPNSPPPFVMADDKIYINENPIADVTDHKLWSSQGIASFTIRALRSEKILVGQSIGFHGVRCIVSQKQAAPLETSLEGKIRLYGDPGEVDIQCLIVGRT